MAKKLYAGNLSYRTTEDELRSLFEEIGPVASVAIITDRETGQSKGFGFVEMENDEDAQSAITRLNGRDLGGRTITVSEARPPRERGTGGGGGGRGRGYGGGSGGRDRRGGQGRRGGGDSYGGRGDW
jgi:RNA recognition motif-containing protein